MNRNRLRACDPPFTCPLVGEPGQRNQDDATSSKAMHHNALVSDDVIFIF